MTAARAYLYASILHVQSDEPRADAHCVAGLQIDPADWRLVVDALRATGRRDAMRLAREIEDEILDHLPRELVDASSKKELTSCPL